MMRVLSVDLSEVDPCGKSVEGSQDEGGMRVAGERAEETSEERAENLREKGRRSLWCCRRSPCSGKRTCCR